MGEDDTTSRSRAGGTVISFDPRPNLTMPNNDAGDDISTSFISSVLCSSVSSRVADAASGALVSPYSGRVATRGNTDNGIMVSLTASPTHDVTRKRPREDVARGERRSSSSSSSGWMSDGVKGSTSISSSTEPNCLGIEDVLDADEMSDDGRASGDGHSTGSSRDATPRHRTSPGSPVYTLSAEGQAVRTTQPLFPPPATHHHGIQKDMLVTLRPPKPPLQWQRISPIHLFSASRERASQRRLEEPFAMETPASHLHASSAVIYPSSSSQGGSTLPSTVVRASDQLPTEVLTLSRSSAIHMHESESGQGSTDWGVRGSSSSEEREESGHSQSPIFISQHHFTLPVNWDESSPSGVSLSSGDEDSYSSSS